MEQPPVSYSCLWSIQDSMDNSFSFFIFCGILNAHAFPLPSLTPLLPFIGFRWRGRRKKAEANKKEVWRWGKVCTGRALIVEFRKPAKSLSYVHWFPKLSYECSPCELTVSSAQNTAIHKMKPSERLFNLWSMTDRSEGFILGRLWSGLRNGHYMGSVATILSLLFLNGHRSRHTFPFFHLLLRVSSISLGKPSKREKERERGG